MRKNKWYKYSLYLLFSIIIFSFSGGCTGQPSTTATTPVENSTSPDQEVLLPGQVDASSLNQVIKVRGQVIQVIQNPGGEGGLFVKLSGGGGEIGIRIESAFWEAMSTADRAQFEPGQTATAEGILVKRDTELVIVLGIIPTGPPSTGTATTTSPPTEQPLKTTFVVKVPVNTPSYSTIFMEWYQSDEGYWSNVDNMFELEKVAADTWRVEIALSPLDYGSDGRYFYYRYSRDKWGYPAAEEFTPDAENACRKIDITNNAGKTINDEVKKWRWFPAPDEPPIPVPPDASQTATIAPRVQGNEFLRGFALMDFWNESYGTLLDQPTLQSIKADNANSVCLGAPVWTYQQVDPLPIIKESAFYPLKGLESQLKLYHENGFHIIICLQFGTFAEDPSFYEGNPFEIERSPEWWEAWYREIENAMLISADLAEKYGVEMMVLCGGLETAWGVAPDAENNFSNIIDRIREHYSGKIGASQILGFDPPDWYIPLPPTDEFPAFEKYDFVSIGLVSALTTDENYTQEELNANASKLFTSRIKPIYEQCGKPVLLIPQYASYEGLLQDPEKYSEEETSLWLPYNPGVVFNATEQAMAYEAIMNAIAGADYIIGVEAFAYFLEDFPRSTELNVRNKPAVEIISHWYQRFAREGK